MKPGAMIKSLCAGLLVLCVLAVCAGAARAADDWQRAEGGSKDIDVYFKKDPKITGGQCNVQLKFVNHGDYSVSLTYTAIARCPSEGSRDVATGKSFVRKHSDDTTSFSYTLCAGDVTDDSSTIEVRIKPLVNK